MELKISIIPGESPKDLQVELHHDGWSSTAQAIYNGFQRSINEIIGTAVSIKLDRNVIRYQELCTPEFVIDTLLDALMNVRFRLCNPEVMESINKEILDGELTYGKIRSLIDRVLCDAVFLMFRAILKLANDSDLTIVVEQFALSTKAHAHYVSAFISSTHASLRNETAHALQSDLIKLTGPAHALAHRQDQMLKPLWIEHCSKAIEMGLEIEQLNRTGFYGGHFV